MEWSQPQLLKVRIISESGIPLFFYDIQKDKIEVEKIDDPDIIQHSSAFTAALQRELSSHERVNCITDEGKKHVFEKHNKILLDLVFSNATDETSENVTTLIHQLLEGINEIHENQGFDPLEAVTTEKYCERIAPQLKKLITDLRNHLNQE